MIEIRKGTAVAMLLATHFAVAPDVLASPAVPGDLSAASTTQSIGVEWLVTGDSNHNATVAVDFRELGSASWNPAMGLVRVDSNGVNALSGSILFLEDGTEYEVRLALTDPDGGAETRTINVETAVTPVAPTPVRTLHVVPGNSGGDGTLGNPYQGLETAWTAALPGDLILMHAGSYGGVTDTNARSGSVDLPIVFRPAGDGDVIVSFIQVFEHSNIWFEGIRFLYDGLSDTGFFASLLVPGYDNGFQPMQTDIDNIVLVRNQFEGFKHSVRAGPRTNGWYIADNTMTGDRVLGMTGTARLDGEGVELGHGDNHEVAFNSITLHADGVSFPDDNCDIYGNDIFDVTDDGIELDSGQANTRAWHNRIQNASNNGIGFQPQSGSPWYIVRNQLVNMQESVLKFRDADRFVVVHNTFVNWSEVLDHHSHQLLRGITRNNLWISVNNGPIWQRSDGGMSWQTDLDYDGFDWGNNSAPFDVNGTKYANLTDLANGTGLQVNGVRIDAPNCLETFDVPGPPPLTTIPPQLMTLRADCNAVDAGIEIPNLSGSYTGTAPDLGAYERGVPPLQFGPRTGGAPPNRAPTADAGTDQNANEATTIVISASGSSDPDNDPLTFSWTQTSGDSATIVAPNQAQTDVILPPVAATTTLVFEVSVTDEQGATATDSVSIFVSDLPSTNTAPIANAGDDVSADSGSRVTLSAAASFDPDGDLLSFSWQQISGPAAALGDTDQVTVSVTLPQLSSDADLQFQLTVTDPDGAAGTDSVTVSVIAPIATDPPPLNDESGSGSTTPLWLTLLVAASCWRLRRTRTGAFA